VEGVNASLLFEPWAVYNKTGKPFQVFTPFWKACLSLPEPPAPLPAPTRLPGALQWPESVSLARLQLEATPDRSAGWRRTWAPGVQGATAQLEHFVDTTLASYAATRDRPDLSGSSRLSPHLHWGEISPRRLWHLVQERTGQDHIADEACGTEVYLRQLGWREFAHYALYHHPHLPQAPWRPAFAAFPWRQDAADLAAWQHGRTGYPLVDAGMRQLWTTGWLPNRVRMVVGSFLVKDLLLPWQEGARWFWDTLVDADLANNTLGWQWIAGCGADAAPFFRVFHPVKQGQKFDPHGEYVRRWVPELARLPDAWIHQPWTAPADALRAAGVALGHTYPHPIVDHQAARRRALAALQKLRTSTAAAPTAPGPVRRK
jgi:deoxyribodipyrimidine photo-lyase